MTDEITISDKSYVSSKRASEISSYAQDYIGQLARGGFIDARRIGGLWYVSMASIEAYKTNAESFKPQPPQGVAHDEPESFVTFEGKEYISASRAAQLTSYNQDYVGQLARSGKILARQIGNRWYVDRHALIAHKEEKDALLASVQSQAVGISEYIKQAPQTTHTNTEIEIMNYNSDETDLMPHTHASEHFESPSQVDQEEAPGEAAPENEEYSIPIRIDRRLSPISSVDSSRVHGKRGKMTRKPLFYGTLSVVVLTVAVLLSIGLNSLRHPPTYAGNSTTSSRWSLTAAAGSALVSVGDALEGLIARDLEYKSSK